MKKLLFILFTIFALASCRREQAYFQKSQPLFESVNSKQSTKQEPMVVASISEGLDFTVENKVVAPTETVVETVASSNTTATESFDHSNTEQGRFKRRMRIGRKALKLNRKLDDAVDNIDRKIFKEKRRNESFFDKINTRIKIGIVFLLLAVLFSLLNLKLLAVIFALAAIISLVFGMRKAFR